MTLVFQYGSNCLESEVNSQNRIDGDASFFSVARTVANYRLTFDVYASSPNRKCGAADIVKTKSNEKNKAWGVIWNVPDYRVYRDRAIQRGVRCFDQIEGEGSNYIRRRILVQCPNGERYLPITYVVKNPNQNGVTTSKNYATLIIEGLREHIKDGMPPEYIEEVKQIVKDNNPAIDITKL